MPFSEAIKAKVQRKANFTCCWCLDRQNKVDVHHIIPQSEGGPDTEDNAAPLCGSCHDKYGGNPELRKQIRARRDHWYEVWAKQLEIHWPIGLDMPLLDFYREIPSTPGIPARGIQFTDKDPSGKDGHPVLYLSVHFKTSRYFGDFSQFNERWLYLQADMRFALNLRIHVHASLEREVSDLMRFLRMGGREVRLYEPSTDNNAYQSKDFFFVWQENNENRLMLSVFTPTNAGISIHARFSSRVANAFADYLEVSGFAKPFGK
ncbi:MAG: HNH endonuclease [Anaerolineales bacterium]